LLVVRLSLHSTPRFCLHFSHNYDGPIRHRYWRVDGDLKPEIAICTTTLTLFTFYLNRNLHELLQGGQAALGVIFASVSKLATASPDSCISCSAQHDAKLWTPSTCSDLCSLELANAPLEVQLHNFMVDTLSIDLVLNSIYIAAADTTSLNLLPGCPVEQTRIRDVIDSFSDLEILRTAKDIRSAIRGTDVYGHERESLLSWLCVRLKGLIVKTPRGFSVPSMGEKTKQLLMLNSLPGRERLFNAQLDSQSGTGVVFHGTQASRMFLILTEGLKVMTNTAFMLHGAAGGTGVYCGDDLGTSLPYAGTMTECWRNSKVGNMRTMLGCELTGYSSPPPSNFHIISDSNRLLIRYIFLLPSDFQTPPKHHVAPAMMTAFTKLRSGLR
jgi:hypothetical protein